MRNYTSLPTLTSLTNAQTSTDVNIVVGTVTNLPSCPFFIIFERGTVNEEVALVTQVTVATKTLTCTRGYDGTTAKAHAANTSVEHGVSASDYSDPQFHIAANAGVHGLAGALVGTTDTQTLTNKTIAGPSNTITGLTDAAIAAANKDGAAATASLRTLGTGAQQAAAGNDSRLSNARTPTAHASTHATGGSDAITPESINAVRTGAQTAFVAASDGAVNNTTYAIGANSPTVTCTVPPSGQIIVAISASILLGGATSSFGYAYITPSVSGAGGAGVLGDNSWHGYFAGPGQNSSRITSVQLVTGLTPGGTATIRIAHRIDTGNGCYFNHRTILVQPA